MVKYPEHMVFGLDIGTRNLVGTVGFRENEHLFRVAAQAMLEHDTRAMMDGQIHDIVRVSETIEALKRKLEQELGRELKEVCIAAAGRVLKTVTAEAVFELPEEEIIKEEHVHNLDMLGVEKAYDRMREESQSEELHFYCVGYSVIRYYLNDYPMTKLLEHKASRISVELIATFLPEEVIDGLYAAVEGAGLQVATLTLEPIAAMNVAIPERYRLLNIALVDVGAGTSDICITKDGSVAAYGMIPHAGDEITEEIAKRYLVDFNTADKMKQDCMKKRDVVFKDIMGLKQKVTAASMKKEMQPIVKAIACEVGDKIRELNGDKPVSAVFVVGGGGKIAGFTDNLAQSLGLPKERVALRGEEVLGEVEFLQPGIKKDPLLVTPIGICYSYYESRNNFIYVHVNGERVKLYDNTKLTILDAVMQVGLPNEDLFPKRGASLHFTVNGVARAVRGQPGEAAIIMLNGNAANINTPIAKNDRIVVRPSTTGNPASCEVQELPEYSAAITFYFNGKKVECPKFAEINGGLVSGFHEILDGDTIEILNYYTLEQVLEFMDMPYRDGIEVNHVPAGREEQIYENFSVDYDLSIGNRRKKQGGWDYGEEAAYDNEAGDEADGYDMEGAEASPPLPAREAAKKEPVELSVTVNGTPVILAGKPSYILVDILDFYPFDLSEIKGRGLETLLNGTEVQGFTAELSDGDAVILRWKEE